MDADNVTLGLIYPAALRSTLSKWVIIENSTNWDDLRDYVCFKSGNRNTIINSLLSLKIYLCFWKYS